MHMIQGAGTIRTTIGALRARAGLALRGVDVVGLDALRLRGIDICVCAAWVWTAALFAIGLVIGAEHHWIVLIAGIVANAPLTTTATPALRNGPPGGRAGGCGPARAGGLSARWPPVADG